MSQVTSTQEIHATNNSARLWLSIAQLDLNIVDWLVKYSLVFLRISMGIVFVWFGALKLIPGLSPAEPLIHATLWFLPVEYFVPVLAIWEVLIGIGFITGKFQRATIILLLLQMGGAMSPTFLSPDRIWTTFPHVLSLEGQYVIKDIILISAGLVLGATVRGGHLVADAE